jgi:O-antigen/teichoic acid export membrane protein
MYGEEYLSYSDVFTWIMVDAGVGYAYVFLGTAATAMRKTWIQLPVHISTLAILIISSWLLVEHHGMTGAVWAMLISTCFEAAAYAVIVFRGLNSTLTGMSAREA